MKSTAHSNSAVSTAILFTGLATLNGCNSTANSSTTPNTETTTITTTTTTIQTPKIKDASGTTSEIAIGTLGGAISSVTINSTSASAYSNRDEIKTFGRCPTPLHTYSGACETLGHTMILTFPTPGCVYGTHGPIWTGGLALTTGTSDNSPTCGTDLTIREGTDQTLTRTYLGTLINQPTTRTTPSGSTTVLIDTSAPINNTFIDATNLTTVTPGTIGWEYGIPSGGGYTRTYINDTTQSLTITARIVTVTGSTPTGTTLTDHTLSTTDSSGSSNPLTITITGSGINQTQLLNGTLNIQHNLMRITASTTLNNVLKTETCCFPVTGTATTSFSGGANNGLTEVMTFSDATCNLGTLGQVQFTDINGVTTVKTMEHCL